MSNHQKVTKKVFEQRLLRVFSYNDLTYRPYNEEIGRNDWGEPITQKLHLYYIKGNHCATWMKGEGWVLGGDDWDWKKVTKKMEAE